MAYIGNIPADKYQTLQKQSFTTSATDTYTLSYSVTNPQDLALFINNVRQNPNDAYTVSGTTLTLSSAITSSDSMYAVFLGRAVETIAPATGSVTNAMLAGSIANSKLANSSITLNGSAVSLGGSATITSDSDYKHLSTTTVSSAVSTVDFTSVFSSSDGFQSYTLVGDTVYPSSDNVGFRLRLKNSSGTISSSHYVWHVGGGEVSGSGSNFTQSNGAYNDQEFDFVGPAGGNPGNNTDYGGTNFLVEVFHPTETRYTNVLWRYTHVRYDEATVHNVIGAGALRTTDAITGLNLFFTSGNIASGSLSLYGRK